MGESLIDQFVELGYLKTFPDIYGLKKYRESLIEIERLGEKSIDNLLAAIEKSKEQPFHRVLFALGIRFVGAGVALKLANHFKSIDALMNADSEALEETPDVGSKISESILKYFADAHNLGIIQKLREAGLKFKVEEETGTGKLEGLSFVLTGTLDSMSRNEAKERIIKLGGKFLSAVSSKTDYVVVGENPGSKFDKAKKLGVKTIGEDEFLKLIEE